MTNKFKPLEIPPDADAVLLVSGDECSLFINGKRQTNLYHDAKITLTQTVRAVLEMAEVAVVEKVDKRVLVDDVQGVWRGELAHVIARQNQLIEAEELRTEAEKNLRMAQRLEAGR